MGRAKINMELISKEKARNQTYKKRKEGLMRKLHEFTTLCDVGACMIIYGPKDNHFGQPEIWPRNHEVLQQIRNLYQAKTEECVARTYTLSDFFADKKKKIVDEIVKFRKKNMESKYPTWMDFFNYLSETQLREFATALNHKVEEARSRIELLKGTAANDYFVEGRELEIMDSTYSRVNYNIDYYNPGLVHRGEELEFVNQLASSSLKPIDMRLPIQYSDTGVEQEGYQMLTMNPSSMITLLTNDEYYMQYGGVSDSNMHCSSIKQHVSYESSSGMVDNIMFNNPTPLTKYSDQSTLQGMSQMYSVSSELHSPQENVFSDLIHFQQMMNQKADCRYHL